MSNAKPFSEMAAKIEHNAGADFGGAFVIVPPEGAGETVETLILDTRQDPVQFWSLLQAKAATVIAELEDKKRVAGAFGGRR